MLTRESVFLYRVIAISIRSDIFILPSPTGTNTGVLRNTTDTRILLNPSNNNETPHSSFHNICPISGRGSESREYDDNLPYILLYSRYTVQCGQRVDRYYNLQCLVMSIC